MGEKVEAEDVEITTSVISQQPNVVVVQPGRPLPGNDCPVDGPQVIVTFPAGVQCLSHACNLHLPHQMEEKLVYREFVSLKVAALLHFAAAWLSVLML